MIKISHRGNINGAIPELENSPDYLLNAINQGFDVEVDIWLKDGNMYLGHDSPQHLMSPDFFYKIRDYSWFHCKNLNILNHFIKFHPTARFFWHQQDDFTLTSNGYIWTYPGKMTGFKSVIVDLNLDQKYSKENIAGICTDFPSLL